MRFSWRWAFGINIPLCVIVIVGLGLLVSESKDPSRSGRVDVVGALLSALGFGGVVFGLIEGRTYGWFTSLTPLTIGSWSWPWSLSLVPVAMVVGVAALVVFVLLERRKQRRGEAGVMRHLACFFKNPMGVEGHDFFQQFAALEGYVAGAHRDR